MKIDLEILAQRLEHVAKLYDTDAQTATECGHTRLAVTFVKQAADSREWADAVRNATWATINADGDTLELRDGN